ncbi:hypothetical protein LAUMK191_00257 [Mycobacterium attenuatum]|uniref:Uncharacterized protein n=1 Tax=Mycobacterium attenuatum TaxID=2341086 RepID=A0A498PNT2_9MYCO|nr:hypothetical protein LAUMK136_00274 [Mycobacterium attenuatum]VBA45091.1 hypothetical protein LAUMK191_00257 [Mycobacterium attenuatum]VBA46259.1 hypothetical protein LAUMK41_00315 [Mycobacterium attenuatum]
MRSADEHDDPNARPAVRLLDRDQLVAAGAAVRLARAGAVAGNLDADATATTLVAAGQLCSSLMGRHEITFVQIGGLPSQADDHNHYIPHTGIW